MEIYPASSSTRLCVHRDSLCCPPRAAVVLGIRDSDTWLRISGNEDYGPLYISEWVTNEYSSFWCNSLRWRKVSLHRTIYNYGGILTGTVNLVWEIVDGQARNMSTGSFAWENDSSPEENFSGVVISDGQGGRIWSITGNVPSWWPGIDIYSYPYFTAPKYTQEYSYEDWQFSDPVDYSEVIQDAIGRLNASDEESNLEWHPAYSTPSFSGYGLIYRYKIKLKADIGVEWSEDFGEGIKFAYRVVFTETNDTCRAVSSNEPMPPVNKTYWGEDHETTMVSPIGTEVEFILPAEGVPSKEELMPTHYNQTKGFYLTGPKRKVWPTLQIATQTFSHRITAYAAYDGSPAYYRTENASGGDINTRSYYSSSAIPNHYRHPDAFHSPIATQRTVPLPSGDTIEYTLADPISPNEARDIVTAQMTESPFNQLEPLPSYRTHQLASNDTGQSLLNATVTRGKYTITISRPSLTLDGSGTIVARWKIHTRTASGGTGSEDFSESYTWPARDTEDPESPEPDTKTFGPYTITAAEGETKWIEVLEPEEAQHVWPTPIWYVVPADSV